MSRATEMSPSTTRVLRIAGWSLAAILLTLPAVAMQFDSGVDWSAGDFVFAAIAFGIVGGLLELTARASASLAYRIGAAVALATAFLTIWITLAVGIIGAEDDPRNLAYFGVVGIGACSAVTALGNPRALARAMRATAGVQLLIGLLHLTGTAQQAVMIDGFFAMTWFVSGALFARAARERETAAAA